MDTGAYLSRVKIVLVDTQDGANIGRCCRAMKTMGIERLVITGGREYDEDRVRTLALHAADVWENAERYDTLSEALRGSIFTVGATRRRGKFRKLSAYSPEQLSRLLLHRHMPLSLTDSILPLLYKSNDLSVSAEIPDILNCILHHVSYPVSEKIR